MLHLHHLENKEGVQVVCLVEGVMAFPDNTRGWFEENNSQNSNQKNQEAHYGLQVVSRCVLYIGHYSLKYAWCLIG